MVSLKLLVVEDDIANLELITEVFTSLQAEVHPVSDSEKAALVNRKRFDGIFLSDNSRLRSNPLAAAHHCALGANRRRKLV